MPGNRKKVEFKAEARRDLRSIDRITALRILHAIDRYSAVAEGDVKRLQDVAPPELRLRVGEDQVRFMETADAIHILSVGHRGEAYR